MRQRELDVIVEHLFGKGSLGVCGVDWLDLHYLDRVGPGSMTGSHVTVTLKIERFECHG